MVQFHMDPRAERSSVAQRLACSAHNRKDGGSKPPAAKGMVFLRNKPRRVYGVMEAQQKSRIWFKSIWIQRWEE